jgi:hypothetical protein
MFESLFAKPSRQAQEAQVSLPQRPAHARAPGAYGRLCGLVYAT